MSAPVDRSPGGEALFSRAALLGGQWDLDRQARRAIGAIEARVLYMRGETRHALTAYLTGDFAAYTRGIDGDYFSALRTRALTDWRPTAADFERFVPQWRALVPEDDDLREATLRIATAQFSLNEGACPETLRALGAPAPALPLTHGAHTEAAPHPTDEAAAVPTTEDAVPIAEEDVSWATLGGGDLLFEPGDPGDALFIVINGRVRLARDDEDGPHVVAEVGRGEVLGETDVLTGAPRTLRAFAVRDTELLVIPQHVLLAMAQHTPEVMLRINHDLVTRLRAQSGATRPSRPSLATIALVPLDGVDIVPLARDLEAELQSIGPTSLVSFERIRRQIATDGRELDIDGPELLGWLHEFEAGHRYVVYQGDPLQPEWTERCIRQADRVVLVADGASSPGRTPIEDWIADRAVPPAQNLVLLYDEATEHPQGTEAWLRGRDAQIHALVRRGDAEHLGRLARRVTGNGVGLALGGGGSRGYAHLGVLRALELQGVPVDVVGGTSMGALLGAGIAQDRDSVHLTQSALTIASSRRQLIDLTFPFAAAAAGGKVTRLLQRECGDRLIEDLWRPYFCMATNLSRAESQAIDRGLLWEAVRASISIPGLFPPVLDRRGDMLVDGGVMNGLPADVMRARPDVGTVIAVNVTPPRESMDAYQFPPIVSGWRAALDHVRGKAARLRPPSIMETLIRTTEVNTASARNVQFYQEQSDLLITPPLDGIGLTDFAHCAALVEMGYEAAREPLDDWLATEAPAWLRDHAAQAAPAGGRQHA
ncbi:MAG: patatin-like phospholipase family protein [Dehalococcoidia bacterium]|nr:patatin-like phospholipase family protein [Dehalococcoidia bacterium]